MKVLSLFSGVGGFDLGLERAGMKTVFQCELDKYATKVLERHWPDVPRWRDIATLSGQYVLKTVNSIDVVAWGSPCQDLSVVGKRAGLDGKRSGLFYEGMRVIKELREESNGQYPKISIWENVAGALSSNRGRDFGIILDEMAKAGALVIEWAILNAEYFGVPQRRRRVFVVAIFDSKISNRCPNPLLPIGESIKRNREENGNITFYTSQGKYDTFTHGIASSLKTAGTTCISNANISPRRLLPVECERLMGWNDDHTRYGLDGEEIADTHRYKMCGNGVVAPVAEWLGRKIVALDV